MNVDALNTVFSPYGFVQKIAIFDKNGQSQARARLALQSMPPSCLAPCRMLCFSACAPAA